jgi:hypothetical protein
LRKYQYCGQHILTKADCQKGGCGPILSVVGFTCQLLDFSKDGVIEGILLYGYVFFFYDVAHDDPCHVVIVVKINQGPVFLELKERVDSCCIST